jgi:Rieske Fe-S protein
VLGACASLVTRTVTPVDGVLRLALVHYPELTAEAGSLKVRPDGAPDPIYVLALGNRRFAALSPICTHLGCTVEIEESRLVCPCHGSNYDREGRVLRGPAEHPLARYRVELTSDDVLVIDLRAGA